MHAAHAAPAPAVSAAAYEDSSPTLLELNRLLQEVETDVADYLSAGTAARR
jgi:hypothetical protein